MAPLIHLSSSNVSDTFHKLVQTENGSFADGSGSAITVFTVTSSHAISASYALSASHEITYELSSSYADSASYIAGGNVNGAVATAASADCADQVKTVGKDNDEGPYYLTFVNSHNASDADCAELYTTSKFFIDPSSGLLTLLGKFKVKGSDVTIQNGHISASGNITITGSISGSNTSTGSFAHIITQNNSIEFRRGAQKLAVMRADTDAITFGKPGSVTDRTAIKVLDVGVLGLAGEELRLLNGNLTGSGHISMSGEGLNNIDGNLKVGTNKNYGWIHSMGHITASGEGRGANISASGIITSQEMRINPHAATQAAVINNIAGKGYSLFIGSGSSHTRAIIYSDTGNSELQLRANSNQNTQIVFNEDGSARYVLGAVGSDDSFQIRNSSYMTGGNSLFKLDHSGRGVTFGDTDAFHITASGNMTLKGIMSSSRVNAAAISSSGPIYGGNILIDDKIIGYLDDIRFGDASFSGTKIAARVSGVAFVEPISNQPAWISARHITASGIISASGDILSNSNIQSVGYVSSTGQIRAANGIQLNGVARIGYQAPNLNMPDTGLSVASHITASANISASGELIVGGKSTLQGNVDTGANITAAGNLRVDGTGAFAGTVTASNGVLNYNGGATGSMNVANTQGWNTGGEGFEEVVILPWNEFAAATDNATRTYSWVFGRGTGVPYGQTTNSDYNYYATYVPPRGYLATHAMVYASGGQFTVFHNNITTSTLQSTPLNATNCETNDFYTAKAISSSCTPILQVIPDAGDYLTLMWSPSSAGDQLRGAAIVLKSI